jgi:GGDEF domain-containing protein
MIDHPCGHSIRYSARQIIAQAAQKTTTLESLRDEIRILQAELAELSWDAPFGMLTRNAFLHSCRNLPSGIHSLAFIDLDDIGELNLRIGYTEVDRLIFAAFTCLRGGSDTVARWYSGDEIVVLFAAGSDPQVAIERLIQSAAATHLTFHFQIGVWDAGRETVEQAIAVLSRQTNLSKLFSRQTNLSGDKNDECRELAVGYTDRDVDPGGFF